MTEAEYKILVKNAANTLSNTISTMVVQRQEIANTVSEEKQRQVYLELQDDLIRVKNYKDSKGTPKTIKSLELICEGTAKLENYVKYIGYNCIFGSKDTTTFLQAYSNYQALKNQLIAAIDHFCE